MFLLIDHENVGSAGMQGAEYLREEDTVVIFYSGSSEVIQYRYMRALKERAGRLECIRLKKRRKNALDMYIAVYTGQVTAAGEGQRIAIISHDRGYEAVCEYCGEYAAGSASVCLCADIEEAILRLDAGSERGQQLSEQRHRVPIDPDRVPGRTGILGEC